MFVPWYRPIKKTVYFVPLLRFSEELLMTGVVVPVWKTAIGSAPEPMDLYPLDGSVASKPTFVKTLDPFTEMSKLTGESGMVWTTRYCEVVEPQLAANAASAKRVRAEDTSWITRGILNHSNGIYVVGKSV